MTCLIPGILKEAEAVTVSTFQSLLYFICPKMQSSKLRNLEVDAPEKTCDSEESETNEFKR